MTMHWVAHSEKDAGTDTLEEHLWNAADQRRANSGLVTAQANYALPVPFRIEFAVVAARDHYLKRARRGPACLTGTAAGAGAL